MFIAEKINQKGFLDSIYIVAIPLNYPIEPSWFIAIAIIMLWALAIFLS